MTKLLILTTALILTVFASSVVGRKAGQGQQDFIPGVTLPNSAK
ncbi:hypothetical protein [Paraflavitalea soli]|nr:hypothetical protein [Paraflavitalea soli]